MNLFDLTEVLGLCWLLEPPLAVTSWWVACKRAAEKTVVPLDQDYYRKTLGLRPLDQRFFIISLPYTLTKNFISLVFRSLTPKEAHQGGQKVNRQTVLMKKSDNNYSLKVLRTSSNSFGGEKILYRTHIKMQNEL